MSSTSHQHSHILLVEDEAIVALSEKRMIEQHGFGVTVAHSGEQALEMARGESSFDLILMDIDLGSGMDGTETAEEILREHEVPVVFLTSHAEEEYVDRVERITSYGYVLKDSGEFVLVQSIKMALKLFRAHHQTAEKEERLSYVVNEAPVGIFESTSRGVFRHVNAEMAHILGFDSPEDALSYYTDLRSQLYAFPERRDEFLDLITEHGTVRDFRVELVRQSGEKVYAKLDAQRVTVTPAGETVISGFLVDETQRRQAEGQREQSRQQYQSVVDLAQEMIVRHDLEGRWTFVNKATCRFFQQSREELLGQHYINYVHPEDQQKTQEAHDHLRDHERVEGLVNRQWTPNGWHFVEWNSSLLIDEQGDLLGHQAIGRDVTEEINHREKREYERHKWQELFDEATVGIFLVDGDHRIVESNPAAGEMLGYSQEELRGISTSELMHPDDVEPLPPDANRETTLQGAPVQTERRFLTKNGGYMVALVSMKRLNYLEDGVSHLIMFHDITESKRNEEALEEYRERLEAAMHAGNLAWWTMDVSSGEVSFDEHKALMLGYSPDSFETYRDFTDLLHPNDYERAMQAMRDHLSGKAEQYRVEYRLKTSRGSYRWFRDVGGVTQWDSEGNPLRVVTGVVLDITERKQKEQKLEAMYSRLQKVIDNAPFLINEIDPQGHYILASEATCRFLGLSKEQLMGRHFRDVLPEEIADRFKQRIDQVYATRDELTVDDRFDLNGEQRVFRTTLCPIYRDDNTIQSIVGIGYDVSRQVEALEQKDFLLRELNHRVKNNLRMVSSLVELKDSALGDEVDLSDIRHQVQAIEKVHASLQESDQITHIRLKRYVEDILSTVFRSFTSTKVDVENHIPDISIRTKTAVPFALIINETATNAIKHGFTEADTSHFTVTMEEDPEGENYLLTISNTGAPFPEDVDIQNPTSLGLQLIQALVSQLRGSLDVQRAPYPVFAIRFPKSQT